MKNKKEKIIAVLVLLIFAITFYVFRINKENNLYKNDIINEKLILEHDLDLLIKDLTANQEQNITITKNFNEANHKLKGIRGQLIHSKLKVEVLKKELIDSKEFSLNSLQLMRESLRKVKENSKQLIKSIDSIKVLNDSLMITIAITKSKLNIEKLQSRKLAFKLSEATKIQISNVEVFGVEEKKSGLKKQTNRYKKVDGIQVNFNILNNKALVDVECDIFYVLKNSEGIIVKTSGEFVKGGEVKKFTDGTRVVLNGETMPVSDIISLENVSLKKGTYTIGFYSLDGLLASESFVLKSGFLGVF